MAAPYRRGPRDAAGAEARDGGHGSGGRGRPGRRRQGGLQGCGPSSDPVTDRSSASRSPGDTTPGAREAGGRGARPAGRGGAGSSGARAPRGPDARERGPVRVGRSTGQASSSRLRQEAPVRTSAPPVPVGANHLLLPGFRTENSRGRPLRGPSGRLNIPVGTHPSPESRIRRLRSGHLQALSWPRRKFVLFVRKGFPSRTNGVTVPRAQPPHHRSPLTHRQERAQRGWFSLSSTARPLARRRAPGSRGAARVPGRARRWDPSISPPSSHATEHRSGREAPVYSDGPQRHPVSPSAPAGVSAFTGARTRAVARVPDGRPVPVARPVRHPARPVGSAGRAGAGGRVGPSGRRGGARRAGRVRGVRPAARTRRPSPAARARHALVRPAADSR